MKNIFKQEKVMLHLTFNPIYVNVSRLSNNPAQGSCGSWIKLKKITDESETDFNFRKNKHNHEFYVL